MIAEEIIFGSSDKSESQRITRSVKAGTLRKLAPRVYTSNLKDSLEVITRRNIFLILGHLYPNAVLSYRTAFDGGISANHTIVLTYLYNKNVQLPGVLIHLVKGESELPGDTPFIGSLKIASRPRSFLENFRSVRKDITLKQTEIERQLEHVILIRGIDELNKYKDEAKILAQKMNLKSAYKKLSATISALQGTYSSKILKSKSALARAIHFPFDNHRIQLLSTLFSKLKTNLTPDVKAHDYDLAAWHNLAFFESYFSNYIEGTQFEVAAAADIVFNQKIVAGRPKDSHDVLSTFKIVSDRDEMMKTPKSSEELVTFLKNRHALLMHAREEVMPGQFKDQINRAGQTTFVLPELVLGTLNEAFPLYLNLEPGFSRAIFMMFLISEVHPFLDGNGRMARIMMNAECDAAGIQRFIIPTVYREDYLLALRRLSRHADVDSYVRMLSRAQKWACRINFTEYESAQHQITQTNAFLDASDGKLIVRE